MLKLAKIVLRVREAQKYSYWAEIEAGSSEGFIVDIGYGVWAAFLPEKEAASSPAFWEDSNNPGELAFAMPQGAVEVDVRYIAQDPEGGHWVELPCGVAVRVFKEYLEIVEASGCCCTTELLEAAERFAEECKAEAEQLVKDGDTPYDQPPITASAIIADAVAWGPDEDGEYCNCWPLTEEHNSLPFGCKFTKIAAGLTVLDVLD